MTSQDSPINVAQELGSFLSSRVVASELRRRAEMTHGPVVIDFSGVESISDSFADEFFAVLVQEKGADWFASRVTVRGLDRDLRHIVLRAIHTRCEYEAA